MEQQKRSSSNRWYGSYNGYPIRVEEYWDNLSYIVEFYDGRDENNWECISCCPETGELLTIEVLQEKALA